jgi:segregation and condensation protein B
MLLAFQGCKRVSHSHHHIIKNLYLSVKRMSTISGKPWSGQPYFFSQLFIRKEGSARVVVSFLAIPSSLARKGLSKLSSQSLLPNCASEPPPPQSPEIEEPEAVMETKRIVEAILFAANRPMTPKQVQQVFPEIEQPEMQEIHEAIEAIIEDYRFRPVELKQVASGYRFQVKQELSRWVSRLFEEKPPKYSRALLETLAMPSSNTRDIGYSGVSVSSNIIHNLLGASGFGSWRTAFRAPALRDDQALLDYFNITSLNELPTAGDPNLFAGR